MGIYVERPTKRRRISTDSAGVESDSASSYATLKTDGHTTSTISRIKTKPKTERRQHESQPDQPASPQETKQHNFFNLGVDPWLTSSLSNLSITNPTPIQTACIPAILRGQSCIGGSRTGSGKTVAFAVPILQKWAREPSGVFAVIITPTRELALQIFEQIQALGARQGLRCVLVTGGADMRQQALDIGKRPHVLVSTPGRLADHVENSGEDTICGLRKVKFVVLDEADRLLASGKGSMLSDLETCLAAVPPPSQRQTCLFTATVTPEVRALKSMPNVFVSEITSTPTAIASSPSILPPTLRQTYQLCNVLHKEKYLHILLLAPNNEKSTTLIFTNRTSTATLLEHLLRLLDHRVTSLHSGLAHADRVSNLARFRAGAARILVATDVASRGLDIPSIDLVINYDLPRNPDEYVHRVGRTARAGKTGKSISLVGVRDVELVQAIEERVGSQMVEYADEGVSIEGRVVRDALGIVGEKKREALLRIEEGRDVKGKRMKRI